MNYSEAKKIIKDCEKSAQNLFAELQDISLYNQEKVLNAFRENNVTYAHFNGSAGYGYDDIGSAKFGFRQDRIKYDINAQTECAVQVRCKSETKSTCCSRSWMLA